MVNRRRLDQFIDFQPAPAAYDGRPEAARGTAIHHIAGWVDARLRPSDGWSAATPPSLPVLAMSDAAFQVRSGDIARRRLERIVGGTAAAAEVSDGQQLAEYEAVRAATSAYVSALDLQAAALHFYEGAPDPRPSGRWPDARSNGGGPRVAAWRARLDDDPCYVRLLALRKAFEHRWLRRRSTVRLGESRGAISAAILDSGEEASFSPDQLEPFAALVIDQFIGAAYLLAFGSLFPQSAA